MEYNITVNGKHARTVSARLRTLNAAYRRKIDATIMTTGGDLCAMLTYEGNVIGRVVLERSRMVSMSRRVSLKAFVDAFKPSGRSDATIVISDSGIIVNGTALETLRSEAERTARLARFVQVPSDAMQVPGSVLSGLCGALVCASDDATRPVLMEAHVYHDGSSLTVETTDRYRLICGRVACDGKPFDTTVNARAFKGVCKMFSKLPAVMVAAPYSNLVIADESMAIMLPCSGRVYPDLDRLYPKVHNTDCQVDADALIAAVETVTADTQRGEAVRLDFGKSGSLVVETGERFKGPHVQVPAGTCGKRRLLIGLNPRYVLEVVKALKEHAPYGKIRIRAINAVKAVVFYPENAACEPDANWSALIVPMRRADSDAYSYLPPIADYAAKRKAAKECAAAKLEHRGVPSRKAAPVVAPTPAPAKEPAVVSEPAPTPAPEPVKAPEPLPAPTASPQIEAVPEVVEAEMVTDADVSPDVVVSVDADPVPPIVGTIQPSQGEPPAPVAPTPAPEPEAVTEVLPEVPPTPAESHVVGTSSKVCEVTTAPACVPAKQIPALARYAARQRKWFRDSRGRKIAYCGHDADSCVVVFRDWYGRDDAELEAAIAGYVARFGWRLAA